MTNPALHPDRTIYWKFRFNHLWPRDFAGFFFYQPSSVHG